eukprot:96052-Rhodomonas_salina.4
MEEEGRRGGRDWRVRRGGMMLGLGEQRVREGERGIRRSRKRQGEASIQRTGIRWVGRTKSQAESARDRSDLL